MSLVHNEQTKLTSAWLNTIATAVIAAGVFAPVAALLYGVAPAPANLTALYAAAVACCAAGAGLRLLGRAYLRRLRE